MSSPATQVRLDPTTLCCKLCWGSISARLHFSPILTLGAWRSPPTGRSPPFGNAAAGGWWDFPHPRAPAHPAGVLCISTAHRPAPLHGSPHGDWDSPTSLKQVPTHLPSHANPTCGKPMSPAIEGKESSGQIYALWQNKTILQTEYHPRCSAPEHGISAI